MGGEQNAWLRIHQGESRILSGGLKHAWELSPCVKRGQMLPTIVDTAY